MVTITSENFGAKNTSSFFMPVSCVMNDGIKTSGFIRVENLSTILKFSILIKAISIILSRTGLSPVVSKSHTTNDRFSKELFITQINFSSAIIQNEWKKFGKKIYMQIINKLKSKLQNMIEK
jgi:hypothetical protein